MQDIFTHYSPVSGGFRLFEIEHCEECGCACEAPNSLFSPEPEERLQLIGLQPSEYLPEMGWCEDLEAAVCPACSM